MFKRKVLPATLEEQPDEYEIARRTYSDVSKRLGEIETKIEQLQITHYRATGGDDLDVAAEAYLVDPSGFASFEPELKKLTAEREVAQRAAKIAGEKFTAIQDARARAHVSSLRPAHRQAAAHVAACVIELGKANAEERRIRLQAPGGKLIYFGYPGVDLTQQDCRAKHFLRFLKRNGIEPAPAAY